MNLLEGGAVLGAAVAAGAINAVVGSGTLVTFPTLLALGYPPVTANVSNTIGLVFGGVSGTWGYRGELAARGSTLARLVPMSLVGSLIGALLLLRLPARAFEVIVPVLIALALVLVVLQPRIAAATLARRDREAREISGSRSGRRAAGPLAQAGVAVAGVYGGYFGAAQGVLLIGLLGSLLTEPLQRVNAIKNLLSLVVNFVAAVFFAVAATRRVDWTVVALIAVGSLLGGLLGARLGRRLPDRVLRGVIVVIGIAAILRLVLG